MTYYLVDNKRYSLLQLFKDNQNKFNCVSIATGYIDLPGLYEVLPLIQNYKQINILIGQEPLIRRYKKDSIELDFPKLDFMNDLQELNIDPKYNETISLLKKLIQDSKLTIKIYKKTFLHAKCYIFTNLNNEYELQSGAIGVIGSSNLTYNGIASNQNVELNYIESNEMIIKSNSNNHLIGHYSWFLELWNDEAAILCNGEFTKLLDLSHVGSLMFTPYEMYIKTLYEIYSEELEDPGQQQSDGYTLFEYQLKNANSLYKRLNKHKLSMLCDSVGLGKTITALEVITRYLKNDKKRIVIICPAALRPQWENATRKQGLSLDILSLQDFTKLDEHRGYDKYARVNLFVIDESHNLRTGPESSRFETVREWIKSNPNSHTLLLTATPINNSITDLLNQILLASGGDANVLKVPSSDGSGMQNIVEIIQSINRSEAQTEITEEYLAKRREKLYPIIKEFVVKRTRQGILKEQELSNFEPKLEFPLEKLEARSYTFPANLMIDIYNQTLNITKYKELIKKIYLIHAIETSYDETNKPIEKTIDDRLTLLKHPVDQIENFKSLYDEESDEFKTTSALRLVYQIIQFLGFIPYRYMVYHNDFYDKDINLVKDLPQTPQHKTLNRQKGMYGILRVGFLKRLESSFSALNKSLDSYRNILISFEKALDAGRILPLSDLRILLKDCEDDDGKLFIDNNDNSSDELKLDDFKKQEMLKDIEKELVLLDVLKAQLSILQKHDHKMQNLADLFNNIIQNHKEYNNGSPKILVFSYFADTIRYLESEFSKYFKYDTNRCKFISSSNRNQITDITNRFAPRGKNYELKNTDIEIQFLFATDVLSEGQNLQDCAVLVNYDLHWNPVRMIQRNGRINRIGSQYKNVLIYNMHPDNQLEEYLKLVKKLEYKIGLIKDTVGQDQKILNDNETLNPIEFVDDVDVNTLNTLYSHNSELRNELLVKLEDDTEFLTDDKFITDLKAFDLKYKDKDDYRQEIYNIPKGKFGVSDIKGYNLLILTQMNDANGQKLFNKFFAIQNNKKVSINDLNALNLIRTEELVNKRNYSEHYKHYLPYLDKNYTSGFIKTIENNQNGRELDTKQRRVKTEFLQLLLNFQYQNTTIALIDNVLRYCNHLDFNRIIKDMKKLIKSPNSKEINALLNFCEEIKINTDVIETPEQCEGILYYGK